jgi:DNA-binding transcriptional LysR family regulator
MHRMTSWDDLRLFLELSRDGSLTATAARLGVAHTTLGRRLTSLEEALTARLVERSGEGLCLTRLGTQLAQRLAPMERAALDAERWVAGDDQRLAGVVRLSTTEAFAQHLLLPGLKTFREAWPDIELELLVGNRQVDLARGEADVAVRAAATRTPSLVVKKVATLAVGLYAAKSYLARHGPPDLATGCAGHDLVGYSPEARGFPEARWLASHAGGARVRLRQASVLGILAGVREGLGLGLVPCFLGDAERGLRRVAPLDAGLERPVWVVADRRVHRAARVRALTTHIVAALEARRADLAGQRTQ